MAYPISVLFLDLKIKCGSQQIRKILIVISTQYFYVCWNYSFIFKYAN